MIVRKDNLEQYPVSFFLNVKAQKHSDMTVGRVLRGIKNRAYGEQIGKARSFLAQDEEGKYKEIKGQLPAVTFCGVFAHGHKAEECVSYNNLLVIDIDKLSDGEMSSVEKMLRMEPCVASYWLSPSGKGYKGLICLDYDASFSAVSNKDKHKTAFRQLFTYMISTYGVALDSSGSDICRLCYMSSDSELVIKEESTAFFVHKDDCVDLRDKKRNTTIKGVTPNNWNEIYGKATEYVNNGYNRSLLTLILKKLTRKNLSITDTWENWVKVAFSIASSVHPVKGRELFLALCRLDGAKHNEQKSEKLIWDAYSRNNGMCSINTIKYLARQKGIVLDR